jgi:hypothetical protein
MEKNTMDEPEAVDILKVPFSEIIDVWEDLTKGGKDLAMVRALTLEDRFFLLVQMCGRTDMLHPWLYARCREVEQDPDGYLDLWAREHYKSTIITFGGIIQEVLRDPNITIGIFSHTAPTAKTFLGQIRNELQGNIRLKQVFPDILYDNPRSQSPLWSLDKGIVVKRTTNPKESTVEAWGLVDGQPTSKHFKLMVYDDVVVKESVSTPEQISKTTESWELSDNLGSQGGRKWHIGTRWSFGDTYEAIIGKGAVQVRLYPATQDGTFDGEPVFLSKEDNDQKKIVQGPSTYACQMLQNPLGGKERMFNIEDLMVYELRPSTLNVYILCDPARSKKRGSAKTAIVVLGLDHGMNKYLLDGFNHRMDLKERWEHFSYMYKRWSRMPGVQIVKMGYEKFGAQADMDYFKEQMDKPGQPKFEITELAWPNDGEGAKVDRVQRLGPDLRSHKIYLPHPTDPKNMTKYQRQMVADGLTYRISQPIIRKDEEGKKYNVGEEFKMQLHYFPFGGLKDLVDAASRIYDMGGRPPIINERQYYEPLYP